MRDGLNFKSTAEIKVSNKIVNQVIGQDEAVNVIKKAAELGYYFSVPTNVVRSSQFQKLVEMVDINQLLTETDSPYLSPYKNRRNEPSFIIETIKKIAEIKNISIDETANNIFMNYQKVFSID